MHQFLYKSFEQLFSAWSLALSKLLHEKFVRKMLVKLTPGRKLQLNTWITVVQFKKTGRGFLLWVAKEY